MPSKNIVKEYDVQSYYHVYSRGANKMKIFMSEKDFVIFTSLFKRYLSHNNMLKPNRMPYPNFNRRLKLLAYCLMPNHIHLLIYQEDEAALKEFMRALLTSYSMYFNKTHSHIGPVFQSRYKAVKIDSDSYLDHITRYIHLNPKDWLNYEHSSLLHYRGKTPDWIASDIILHMFNNDIKEYLEFLSDYQESKEENDELKWQLANE